MRFQTLQRLFSGPGRGAAVRGKRARRRHSVRSVGLAVEALEERNLLSGSPADLPPVRSSGLVDISQTTLPNYVFTPSVVVDPMNPQHMVTAYVSHDTLPAGNSATFVEWKYSLDGGLTWNTSPFSFISNVSDPNTKPVVPYNEANYPTVAMDRNGNVYLLREESDATAAGSPNTSGALVLDKYSFPSAGTTGPTPVFQNELVDQWITNNIAYNPTLVVNANAPTYTDPTSGLTQTDPTAGAVYVAWDTNDVVPTNKAHDGTIRLNYGTNFNQNKVQIIASLDGGNTFTYPVYADTPGAPLFGPVPTITGTGAQNYSNDFVGMPRLAVSQGTAPVVPPGSPAGTPPTSRVPAGQLSVVYDDFNAKPDAGGATPDRLWADHINATSGGKVAFSTINAVGSLNGTCSDGTLTAGGAYCPAMTVGNTTVPVFTTFSLRVNPTDPNFVLSDLSLNLNLFDPALDATELRLVAPDGRSVTLFRYHTPPAGMARTAIGIGGNDMGISSTSGIAVGTTFEQNAPMDITDNAAQANYIGEYRPEFFFVGIDPQGNPIYNTMSVFNGMTANQINGTWQLILQNNSTNKGSATDPLQLLSWSLKFESGYQATPATEVINSAPGFFLVARGNFAAPYANQAGAAPIIGIGPDPVIASDNTLGSFSPFQGRLYIAYVATDPAFHPGEKASIYLQYSDDDGQTWSAPARVDDDSPADGFSEGTRPKFEPNIAVDQYTGALVLSWYDTRQDAAQMRSTIYVAVSNSGGASFGTETYVNATYNVSNAITGANLVFEPIPDNTNQLDPLFAYGDFQGLAVADGHIHTVWTGNEDGIDQTIKNSHIFTVETSVNGTLYGGALTAAGPRIVQNWSTTGGPVQDQSETNLANGNAIHYDNTFYADGTRQATGFVINFDRPIDPSTFTTANVTVVYRDPFTAANLPGQVLKVLAVTPVVDNNNATLLYNPNTNAPFTSLQAQQQWLGASRFLVTFQPPAAGTTYGVGTYSYSISPFPPPPNPITPPNLAAGIRDRLRDPRANGTLGTFDDQNANAIPEEDPQDRFTIPAPVDPTTAPALPADQLPYNPDTLPIIVPGPHIIQSFMSIPSNAITPDNLVLNQSQPVTSIDVVFDRNINPASFTPAMILSMMGPTGALTGPFTITPDPNNPMNPIFNPGSANFRPDQVGAGGKPNESTTDPLTYRIGFPQQSLNGTYTLKLASGILSAFGTDPTTNQVGFALDSNQNAGLYTLRGVNPTAQALPVPVTTNWTAVKNTLAPGTNQAFSITVSNSFVIQNLTLALVPNGDPSGNGITFPNDPDLEAYLVGPDGKTTAELFNKVGSSGSRANFTNTVFDDAATTSIINGTPPFTGTYSPFQSLNNAYRGKDSAGTWTLHIVNHSTSNSGTLNGWSLTLFQTVTGTGLGELVADQGSASFRIFNMNPSNPLTLNQWTAVGPASNNSNGNSGRIGGIAVDPSDPSGNTVYIAGASGGVWKTTNFLTNDPAGPTYVPLTDFGPSYGLNIGGLAVFGQNHDPRQSIIIAGTGEGDTKNGGGESGGGVPANTSAGVGFLRSMDGGATWSLLDSSTNVDSQGHLLPINSPLRDHIFVGTSTFKVVVDPNPAPGGGVIIYAALSGNTTNGGIWRSTDSGNTWQHVFADNGDATDVALSAFEVNALGNETRVYAAFRGDGVFTNASQGVGNWFLMAGGAGNPLIRNGDKSPPPVMTVQNDANSPNGANGRIALAVPFKTGNPSQDLLYSGWLYAAVVTPGGGFQGLYVTKDFGQNWTRVRLPVTGIVVPNNAVAVQNPSNDETLGDYSVVGSKLFGQGNYNLSITTDPTNPNIVFLGGTHDGNPSGLIRVDITKMFDPYNLVGFDFDDNDGGLLAPATLGGVARTDPVKMPFNPYGVLDSSTFPPFTIQPPDGFNYVDKFVDRFGSTPMLNIMRYPYIQNFNSTFYLYGANDVNGFQNLGSEATWSFYDATGIIDGSTDQHRVVAMIDPVTGHARLIFGDDQGVFTGVDEGNGTLNFGTTTLPFATGSRNGNLQITQFYYGAAQPSNVAAQAAQALFYGMAQDNGYPESDPNIFKDGNLGWNGVVGDATGVATDQTGSGTVYEYQWPCCENNGGATSDFFQQYQPGMSPYPTAAGDVTHSRTTGLFILPGSSPGAASGSANGSWPFTGGSNFAINPIVSAKDSNGGFDNSQLVMSDQLGNIYRTETSGQHWDLIGPAASLDSSYGWSEAFGAPEPNNPTGALGNFIYVGTTKGHVFVTVNGGGNWTSLDPADLDGSPVESIAPSPVRGSHDVYIVTALGVYHMADSSAGGAKWENLTGNIFQLSRGAFGDSTQPMPLFGTVTSAGARPSFLTSLAADWRYAIPDDPTNPTGPTHPALYVGGQGGVVRSTDKGVTWNDFPNNTTGSGPNGNLNSLPDTTITDLSVVAGNVDPTTGRPLADSTRPGGYLLATTYGRGSFAINLPVVHGPVVTKMQASSGLPGISFLTVTFDHSVDPTSFTPGDVTITDPNGKAVAVTAVKSLSTTDVQFEIDFTPQNVPGNYVVTIGPSVSDFGGNLMDQNGNGVGGENGVAPTGDVFAGQFNIGVESGPMVLPPIVVSPGSKLTSVVVNFNKPIGSFKLSDIDSFTGPNGPITATAVTVVPNTNAMSWQISFPQQTAFGTYTLKIGPYIQDTKGDLMNQNGNNINGEVGVSPDDTFTGQFTLSASGPMVKTLTAAPSGPVSSVTVTFDKPIDPTTFTPAAIDSFTGPNNTPIAVTTVAQLTANSFQVNFATQTALGTYTMSLGPNITDTSGAAMDQNGNGVNGENPGDIFTGTFTISQSPPGAKVIAFGPPTTTAAVTFVTVTFNQTINAATFTPASIDSFTDPSGNPIAVTSITPVSGTTFQVNFAAQSANGQYTMSLGPNILNTAGNPMDQNGNGTGGEVPGDVFTGQFTLSIGGGGPGGTVGRYGNLIVTGADAGGGPNVVLFRRDTGQTLLNFFAYSPAFTGGVRVALGFINGRNAPPDIITVPGPGGGPEVKVWDMSGNLIRDFFAFGMGFTGGSYVAAGDVNGDGFDDIIISADAGGGPDVTVFSGKDGSRLMNFFAYGEGFTGGVRVASGDVNGDGKADIVCGAGPGGGPNVTVFDGATGQMIQSFFAYDIRFNNGIYVAATDVNGDGKADIITGPGAGGGPNVRVFSGADDSLLANYMAYDPAFTGGVRVAAWPFLNGNVGDLVTVAGPGGGADVRVHDPLTGAQLDAFFAYDPAFTGGLYVGALR
jgi:hypothetical protein